MTLSTTTSALSSPAPDVLVSLSAQAAPITPETAAPESSEESATDPQPTIAPVDPDGDTDASASNTVEVHPL